MLVAELCTPGELRPDTDDDEKLDRLCRGLGVGWLDEMGCTYQAPHALDTRFHELSPSCWCQLATAFDGQFDEACRSPWWPTTRSTSAEVPR